GGISLLSARFATEGPFVKDKSSYLFSFRRSLTDLYNSGFRFFHINANYYDFNFKTNYILNKSNRVYFSVYHGFDHLFTDNNYSNNWSNTTSTFRFNHIFNPRLFVNFSAIYSNYINSLDITSLATINKEWLTGIRDLGLKGDFTFYKQAGNTIQFGISATRHHFRPGETADYISNLSLNRFRVSEYVAYFNHDSQLFPGLDLNYGLRTGIFAGEEENKINGFKKDNTIYNFEPRLQLQYSFNPNQALKISYMRNEQNLQLVQNNEISYSSFGTWIPANSKVKQQKSDVYSTAYTHLVHKRYFIELGLYYKKMYNQADLTDHSQIVLNPLFENNLRFGEGTAYGSEITISKKTGKFTGDLSYIYSRSFRKIREINSGLKYPAIYDLPNDFKISGSYHFSNRLTVSTFFNYSNGRPVTLPVGFFTDNGSRVPIYEGRNSSRFPDYNRLDLVAELKPRIKENDTKKRFQSTWTFGIYNLYSRRNPLFYRITQLESNRNVGFEESFSGFIPAISYSFKY
ncbi:MAG: TonB-dependent receptor plug domain-containing protein, partial [Daejeonella sp.]